MRPIYKSSFTIGKQAKVKLTLDSVVRTAKDWVSRRFDKADTSDFGTGVSIDKDGRTLRTIITEDGSRKYFGMVFQHPDIQIPDFNWQTSVASFEEEGRDPVVAVTLSNGWKQDVIRPKREVITRPGIVPMLIDRFSANEKYPLSTKAMVVTDKRTQNFVDSMLDRERKLPLVYISCRNFTDKPIIDTNEMASLLAGLAHVCVAENRWPSFKMEELIGKSMNCYDGAVRIYWPMMEDKSLFIRHPYWTPREINNELSNELLKQIAQFSVGRTVPVTFEQIRGIQLQRQIQESSDKNETAEIAQLYVEENDELKKQIVSLEETEKEHLNTIGLLGQRISGLEYALNARKGGDADGDYEQIIKPIDSMSDAIDRFYEMYSDSDIEILPRAERNAKQSPYKNPKQFFRALEWLATAYLNTNKGKLRMNLVESCLEQTGMHYNPKQSATTMGKFRDDYYVTWEDKKRSLKEHLCKGTSKSAIEAIRIAFFYDNQTQKVVVGYIGQHQKTKAS